MRVLNEDMRLKIREARHVMSGCESQGKSYLGKNLFQQQWNIKARKVVMRTLITDPATISFVMSECERIAL